MSKKVASLVLGFVAVLALSSCGGKPSEPAQETPKAPVADSAKPATEPTATESETGKPGLPKIPPKGQPIVEIPDQITQIELILDASGSMWGQVEGKPKIDIAKGAMNTLIDGLSDKSNLEVGLRIYGHLNKECSNTVLEFPIAKIQAQAMKEKVTAIKALGFTPITNSLEKAAGDFDIKKPGTRQIILLTDGIESCNGDPCAMAKKLKEAGVVTRIDVVGFNLKTEELKAVECIAAPFGGKVIGANSAKELTDALGTIVDDTLKYNLELRGFNTEKEEVYMNVKVMQDGKEVKAGNGQIVQLQLPEGTYDVLATSPATGAVASLKGVSVVAKKLTQKDLIFTESNLTVKIVDQGGKPFEAGGVYVYKSGESDPLVSLNWTSKAKFTVEPGVYDIRAVQNNTGEETWLKGIELKEGVPVEKTIAFGQGMLSFKVFDVNGKPFAKATVEVKTPDGKMVESLSWDADGSFNLKPGTYDVTVRNNDTKDETSEKGIVIEAGKTVERVFSFAQGTLAFKVFDVNNKPFAKATVEVKTPDGKNVDSLSWDADGSFELKAGTYDMLVRNNDTKDETWEKGVVVEAGKTTERTFSFAQGTLAFKVFDVNGKPFAKATVEVKTPDGKNVDSLSWDADGSFELKAGTYDMLVRNNDTDAETWERGVVVEAGKTTERTFSFAQGTLAFKVTNVNNEPFAKATIEVKTPEGKNMGSLSWDSDGSFELLPGTYDVFARNNDTDEQKSQKGIVVEAGKTTDIAFSFVQGTLSFKIVDASQKPFTKATVEVKTPDGKNMGSLSWDSEVSFELLVGTYDVLLRNNDTKVESTLKGLVVEAGKTTEKVLVVK